MAYDPEGAHLDVSLPDSERRWVEQQAARGGYGTVGEYVRALIRQEQERKAQETLERLLLEGIQSGPAVEATPEYWAKLKRELIAEHVRKGAPGR